MTKHILVVDDNLLNCEMLRLVLMRADIIAEIATNGADALRMFYENPPLLVITDLYMPRMMGPDGVGIIRRIKSDRKHRHIPVIALTAVSNFEVERAARDAGCDWFMPKPFKPAELISVVQSLLVGA